MGSIHAGCRLFPFICTRATRSENARHGQGSSACDTTHDTTFPAVPRRLPRGKPGVEGPNSGVKLGAAVGFDAEGFLLCMSDASMYPSSVTGKARSPSAIGKLFGVRQMIALRVAAVLAINRLCAPGSELAIEERWYPATALDDLLEIEEGKINDTRLYRCLDRILPHKRKPTTEQKSLLHQLGLDLPERFQLNRKCSVDPAVA